ncbi:Helix-hairpin-helix domain-containing protein [uncultured Thiomicrorhabdus sp.]
MLYYSTLLHHLKNPVTAILLGLLLITPKLQASAVNVNLASSHEIAEALQIPQRTAERISIHCQYYTCRKAEDLLPVTGVDRALLKKIQHDLIYSIMERGSGYSDDC